MASLKISICFWYLDTKVVDDILITLKEGKMDVYANQCEKHGDLKTILIQNPPDLIISDFDLADKFHGEIEKEMEPYFLEIPLIYLVNQKDEQKVRKTLKADVWDYVFKDQLYSLIPSVLSSQKYSRVIKQRKETEMALSESRDRYRSIFNSVNDGILLFDFETRDITNYNPRLLEMFGFTDQDMKTLDLNKYSAEDEGYTVDRAKEYVREAINGETGEFEWRNITKTGRRFWTFNSFAIVQIDNKPHILLVTRDIDAQKKIENSLLESQEHFRALAENSPDVIMRFDRDLKHVYVNSAAERQLGINVEDFINKSHHEMGVFPEEKVKVWQEALEKVFTSGKPHSILFDLEVDKKIITNEWRLYPESGNSESNQSVIGVARDITESMKSQKALRQSEERLNQVLSATQLFIWDWNLATNELNFQDIWWSMLGYGPDEHQMSFELWTSWVHPDDREPSAKMFQDCVEKVEESFEIEFRIKHKNGSYVWIRSLGKAVAFDKLGNTKRISGIHENIDERKRADMVKHVLFDISNAVSTTHSLEELYSKIQENLGKVLDTTNCFLALYNEDSDTLTLPFMEDEKDSFTEFPARKTLTSYVIKTGEAQLVDKNREKELTEMGEIEPVGAPCESWLGVPLKHEGRTIGVFAIQSYTEEVIYSKSDAALLVFASDQIAMAIDRRRHQDNLRATQEKQRRVFESSPDPMIVTDPHAVILDFNSAFIEVFQADPELVYGKKIFRFISKKNMRQAIRDFKKTWETGYQKNLDYQIVRPGGVPFDGEVSSGAIYDSKDKPESMVIIIKNITDRKLAEKNLIEAKLKAEESDKLKTAFLSNMSHEIRTPMNAIVGFSDLLSDEGLSHDDRRDFIAQINQGADDLMRLIDDIIDIAKIEAGQVNVHIAECFLRDLFKELQQIYLQNIKRTGKDKVTVILNWDWPMNDLAIYTDPFRLKQILSNLLSNAVKFTEEGEIILGLEEHKEGIRFYVKDSGIGIREEKQRVIFDRFMQGHETKTKLYAGTGLGLAISKNLTEILGGNIGVNSKSGDGSTFWFILPRNEVPLKYEAALRVTPSDVRTWTGKKILIAEDDHSNYYFLYEALKDTGVEILWTKDGQETLDVVRATPDLDLVLMDINMPLINGYECTKILKKERPELQIIAQTAYAMSGEREISKEAGCDNYLAKPIKVNELLDTLAIHL